MNKVGVIFIVFGLALIIFGLGIFWYNGVPSSMKEAATSPKLSTTEYSKNISNVHQVASYFDSYMSDLYPLINMNSINSKEKTLFVLKKNCNYKKKNISVEKVKEEAKGYFLDFEPYLGDIKDSTGRILYRYQNNQYIYVVAEAQFYNFVTKDISSEGYQDYWILKKKGYYIKSVLEDEHYVNTVYATFKDYRDNKNALATFSNTTMSLAERDYAEIQKQLKTITYYFIKNGETYYIDSIKVIDN